MSHLSSGDLRKGENTQSYDDYAKYLERYRKTLQETNLPNGLPRSEAGRNRHDLSSGPHQSRESMNPVPLHSSAPGASAYPRVPPHPSRNTDKFGPVYPPNTAPPASSHHPIHSYRHPPPPHSLLPGQFSGPGLEAMWQPKLNPNPWVMAHYEEMRMERERTMSHERERIVAHEMERTKERERIVIERERALVEEQERSMVQEREILVHDRERTSERVGRLKEEGDERREWHEQKRIERDQERAQIEAVQQHFEESLRLVLQKQQKDRWNSVPNSRSLTKGHDGSSSANSHITSRGSSETERLRDHEKDSGYMDPSDRDKWMAVMQLERNEQSPHEPMIQNFSNLEQRPAKFIPKSEAIQISDQVSSKSRLSPSPVCSASQMKIETTNFSLYGYQPFQHTYITQAQLKAREENKTPGSTQSERVAGSGQTKAIIITKDKEGYPEKSSHQSHSRIQGSSKHQLKVVHANQERSGLVYQPLVGSGGAFKPYEFSSSGSSQPPPIAHQNTSPGVGRIGVSSYQVLQDQPQNLVKGDGKEVHEKLNTIQKYDLKESKTVSGASNTLLSRCSPSFTNTKSTSPTFSTSYSYSLIQQGLVPNPMYIATSHTGNNSNSTPPPVSLAHNQPCKPNTKPGSPPSLQYTNAGLNPGIRSSSPVCRSSSVPYTPAPGRSGHSYFPVGSFSGSTHSGMVSTTDSHLTKRAHFSVQGTAHRSISPAHLHVTQPNPGASNSTQQSSPRLTSLSRSSPVHLPVINTTLSYLSSAEAENLETSRMPLVKRKLLDDVALRKRPKSGDDSLLPPQLQPQMQTSLMNTSENQTVTPPQLVSNAPMLVENHDALSMKPNLSSAANLTNKPVSEVATLSLPELTPTSMSLSESHSVDSQNYLSSILKFKIANKCLVNSSAEDKVEDSYSHDRVLNVSNKIDSPESILSESCEEQLNTNLTSSSSVSSSLHPKLKKAWLQRHSENEDKKEPSAVVSDADKVADFTSIKIEHIDSHTKTCKLEPFVLIENSICDKYMEEVRAKSPKCGETENSEKKPLQSLEGQEEQSSGSDSDLKGATKNGKRKKLKKGLQGSIVNTNKQTKYGNSNDINVDHTSLFKKEKEEEKISTTENESNMNVRKKGRKNKGHAVLNESNKKKCVSKGSTVKPPEKTSIAHLKKTGEPFLQDGPCCEVAPRLPKCRECRMTPHQRNKKMPNIFCRFYAYRKLRYGKSGTILSAGFSEPSDALDEDLKLWLPPAESLPLDIEVETSKFLLTHIGDQFCDLVEMEREAQKRHVSKDSTVTWKRVVQGVREMCDVCETTLFNIHWVCCKCGFVVCIDCYKSRKSGVLKDEFTSKDRDDYQWLLCSNKQPHEQEKLMLTQIIAGTALWDVDKALHEIRRKWNVPTYCNCGIYDSDQDSRSSSNGICKLMSAVTKCFSSDKESSYDTNGSTDFQKSSKKSNKNSVNGVVKQEDGLGGYSSESGGSPLSWLAEVALNSNKEDQPDKEEKGSEDQESNADASVESDDDKNENFSTLRELLIRPTGKMGGKGSTSSSQKTLTSTLDEVISCVIEEKVRKSDKKCNEKQLLHFTRRYQMTKSGRDLPPVRTCLLSESSLLYPEVPHIWLGAGKILLLKDPYHSGNLQLFQEQWKRGQPVVVADIGKKLDPNLWSPESFIKEFGELKTDFLNYTCGTLLQNQPMKKFWEGFDSINKRMRNEDGELLILKLVDWPPPEEFSDILPSRYDDLMKVLPLQQYTHRQGIFNMASRLPECFVQPDLGPRMYNAYGISSSMGKGSTNLHLDVSDAVNVLAYVAFPNDRKEETTSEINKLLDEYGCDSLMKKRAKEKGSKPGAVWHIYNARDADKIRDFLNKVSEEQGVKLNPHHDPIHNQEWYLDENLRTRLLKEYNVEAYTITQCFGDAIFIPAGSPHQVINLYSCVKVSEDFVSPESVGHSFFLTQEMRNLSDTVINNEDRLQIKNIIYHTVKDALALLQSHDPEESKS